MKDGLLRDKRFLFTAALAVGIVALFWAGSRYPQLSEKASMGVDLDVISMTTNGPVWVHQNEGRNGRAILFELRDERGNVFGVGSKIVIRYGREGARHQIREIKAGGGFLSFEPPRAHFGLGEHDRVERVEIEWLAGERDVLEGDFEAGHRYRITRRGSPFN